MGGTSIWVVFEENWMLFAKGLGMTLLFALISVAIGTLLGFLIAMGEQKKNKIFDGILKLYVTILRGTPILVQLYIVYFFLPLFIPVLNGMPMEKEIAVLVALSLNSSAYVSEIFRSGINAVDKGQTEAARSLGMSASHCMKKIILPQAIKNVLPALGNEYIMMVKETSLASTLMVAELMYVKTILQNKFLFWQPLIIIALIYLVVTTVLSFGVSKFERKLAASD